jgi:hypothetical protein
MDLRRRDYIGLPFALAVDLVLVESGLDELIFATALVGPSANVFFADPPVDVVDHQRCGSAGVDRAVIVLALFALCALLLRCVSGNVLAGRATCRCYLLGALVGLGVSVGRLTCLLLLDRLVTVPSLDVLGCAVRGRGICVCVRRRVGLGRILLRGRVIVGIIAVDVDVEVVVVSHVCCGMSSQLQ